MKIAAAQIQSTLGDVTGNIRNHIGYIKEAIQEGVELIVFPEMSLTGYCREEANGLAFQKSDDRLNPLIELAFSHGISIIVGAPIRIKNRLYIGSFLLQPNKQVEIYTKQYLHTGEEKYFTPSTAYNPLLHLENQKISFAICADISNPDHPKKAALRGTTLYIPSIFYTTEGINQGISNLCNYAKAHSFSILVSNFVGEQAPFVAGGKSAFIDFQGNIVKILDTEKEGLLITKMF